MRRIVFYCILAPIFLFAEPPWGKDSALLKQEEHLSYLYHKKNICLKKRDKHSPLQGITDALIAFHQKTISPAYGPRSHFKPSSSQYMRDAIGKYGFFYGFIMGCDRLLRENDDSWVYRKVVADYGCTFNYDPVP